MPEKKKIIPDIPEYKKVNEEVEKKLLSYIEYLQNLSPRIKIVRPILEDNIFDLNIFYNQVKRSLEYSENPDEVLIDEWPQKNEIAFILSIDSSMPGEKKKYILEDTFVFCYGDFSFFCDINNFEQDDYTSDNIMKYVFRADLVEMNKWKDSVRVICLKIKHIQIEVPKIPKKLPA